MVLLETSSYWDSDLTENFGRVDLVELQIFVIYYYERRDYKQLVLRY